MSEGTCWKDGEKVGNLQVQKIKIIGEEGFNCMHESEKRE